MIEVKRQSKAKRTKSSNTSSKLSCSDEYSDAAATIASPNKVQDSQDVSDWAGIALIDLKGLQRCLCCAVAQGLHFFYLFYNYLNKFIS